MMEQLYTDKKYWHNYYKYAKIKKNDIISICKPYDKYWDILINSCKYKPTNILEIGANPGRFISYISSKYNLIPTALDYNPNKEKIEQSFKRMDVNQYEIIIDDITEYKPEKKFDLIISMGVIEHFEDYNKILDKHFKLLCDGGSILITIPNKRGLRRFYGLLCDKNNLNAHNLKCMNKATFYNFSARNNLNICLIDYFGGFQYAVHQRLNLVQIFIYHLFRFFSIVMNPLIKKHPSWLYSGGIIAIYSKN